MTLNFLELVKLISKNRVLFISPLVLGIVISLFFAFSIPSIYKTNAKLMPAENLEGEVNTFSRNMFQIPMALGGNLTATTLETETLISRDFFNFLIKIEFCISNFKMIFFIGKSKNM